VEEAYRKWYRQAIEWVRSAGDRIKEYIHSGEISFSSKSHAADLVTKMDFAVEEMLVEKITQAAPDHQIVGEEGIVKRAEDFSGHIWLIDPIDGTANFVTQKSDFVISVALYHRQQGVFGIIYDVMKDEMIHALKGEGLFLNQHKINPMPPTLNLMDALLTLEFAICTEEQVKEHQKLLALAAKVRGIRCYGATALSLAKVALGKSSGYLTLGTHPWDFAAGRILVEEAGGMVTDFQGNRLRLEQRSSVIACHPEIYQEVFRFIRSYFQ
jgi:myo-inositol-1(or 4)-monophosphatase